MVVSDAQASYDNEPQRPVNANQPLLPGIGPPDSEITSSLGIPSLVVGQTNTSSVSSDIFAPENLRVSQDIIEEAGTEQIQGVINVRKPGKLEFIRVRPGSEWQLSVAIVEDSIDREIWVVKPEIIASIFDEVSYVQLRLAINRHGVPFLWALKFSRDGKRNSWNDSAQAAADHAIRRWIRLKSDQAAGMYRILAAKGEMPEPKWPDLSFQEILELAFRDRIIGDYNHPVLKQLRGEL